MFQLIISSITKLRNIHLQLRVPLNLVIPHNREGPGDLKNPLVPSFLSGSVLAPPHLLEEFLVLDSLA